MTKNNLKEIFHLPVRTCRKRVVNKPQAEPQTTLEKSLLTVYTNGNVTKCFSKITGIYTVIMYALMTLFFMLCLIEKIDQLLNAPEMAFSDRIIQYSTILLLFFHWIPLCTWMEISDVVDYFNEWLNTQEYYMALTGKKIEINCKHIQHFTIATIIIVSFGAILSMYTVLLPVIVKYNMSAKYVLLYFVTAAYYIGLVISYISFWILLNRSVCQFSKNALEEFQNSMRKTWEIQEYRNLWWRIRMLTVRIGSILSITYIYFVLCIFLLSVAILYILIIGVLLVPQNMSIAFLMAAMLIPVSSCFILIAEVAHRTTEKVSSNWENGLMDMIEKEKHKVSLKNLQSFFDFITLHRPVIELGGYTPVNRVFNLGLGGSFATYVIFFLQMDPAVVGYGNTFFNDSTMQPDL